MYRSIVFYMAFDTLNAELVLKLVLSCHRFVYICDAIILNFLRTENVSYKNALCSIKIIEFRNIEPWPTDYFSSQKI